MGWISFLGMIRRGKASGQLMITIPKRFRALVTPDKLIYVKVSAEKEDLEKGEQVIYDKR